jgi:3-oxoacyl-[acyl-carrier protein] reductase
MDGRQLKKTAFITGATRNLGFAIARRFAREGYDVALSGRDSGTVREAELKLAGEFPDVRIAGYALQPAEVADIRRVFAKIKDDFGGLDVFVPNAAHLGVGQNILHTTPEEFDEVIGANLRGYFFCCQEAAKIMVEAKRGAIVLIGSVQYKGAIPNRIVYSAAKGGIMSMTRCMAYELAKFGIRVNCVVPGAISSERWAAMSEEAADRRRARYPIGRESSPEEVANAVYFLASDQASTVTGIDLTVDSGVGICLLPYDKEWDA